MFRKKFKKKLSPLWKSFYYAFEGIKVHIFKERNLTIHFFMMFLVILMGIKFNISYYEWLVCIILFGLVISMELINTAIEVVVDICMPEINSKAKLAKDTSAGAVLVAAIASFIIGLIIFIPKIIVLL